VNGQEKIMIFDSFAFTDHSGFEKDCDHIEARSD
jgi:hypothetical protein